MRPCKKLPEGYAKKLTFDTQNDKKLMLGVNLGAVVIAVLMILLVLPFKSISMLFDMSGGAVKYFLRFAVILVGYVVYIFSHELIHGAFFRFFSGEKATYGFTGPYAYAASPWYFDKRRYLIIGLAPVVIWGIILSAVCVIVPRDFFWSAYFVQVFNISGAAGDLFITFKMLRLPPDILILDHGTKIEIYGK